MAEPPAETPAAQNPKELDTIMGMVSDPDEAMKMLDAFIEAIDAYEKAAASFPGIARREPYDNVMRKQGAIQRIAEAVQPGVKHDFSPGSVMQFGNARDVALHIKGLIESEKKLAAILEPVGPRLAARGLHPAVWNAAAALWDGRHYREAISAAGTGVDLALQAKLDRNDVTGKALIQEAFSSDGPKAGHPRLRFTRYEPGTQDWKNAHEGALHFGMGCMMLIRNLKTHSLDQPGETEALEQLAALSVFARLLDDADVETAP
jgi:hypothetical protein